MVFESYVVSILNKFLGQYVENLDPSQFQMSIWGGDVKLENLVLKENALDELDLPVKVLRGHLGQLILKIPWKNLYSEPVVAKVDGVYILARPNTDVKYNAEKEEKIKQEKKQQELTAIEEAVKYAEEAKNKTKEDKEKSLSFAEKLAMHIVKNIQVFVSNIHIRFEDTLSNEEGPFSVGITLENLSAESVDGNWEPVVVDSKQSLVNKLVRLDNLALYLNSHDNVGKLPTREEWVNIAKAGIAKGEFGGNRPRNFNYVIEPLTATTKAVLDTNTVPNLSIPKVFVKIIMKELDVVLSRHQYQDIMKLADNFDRIQTNSLYRKYKPFVPLKQDRKAWWNYAIQAVLEDVRRRARNWSWHHIVEHRMKCHKYMLLYKEKLSQKKISDKVQKEIDKYEEVLDVLNITMWRKQAEIETKKEGTNYELNEKRKQNKGGLFSGFFGKKSKETKAESLSKEEVAAEEQKLYAAIGYSESDAPVKLPAEYVAYKLEFAQKRISVKLRDDSVEPAVCVSSISLEDLFMNLGYRPGAQAVSVVTKLGNLNVLGCPVENESAPDIVRSVPGDTDITEYVNASFETNPLDGKCDQRIRLTVQPLEVIYHANTVDNLMKFFQLPEDVHLSEISAAAYSQIEGLRNQSRTNLSYAIETRTLLDINILIHSPFIIIPHKGVLTENCSMLVVDLGSLKVSSDPTQERITNTKSLSPEELEEKVYDRFDIELKQLQILMAKPGEDWKDCRNEEKSSLHVLYPFALNIQLYKCLATDDVRLTQIRLAGVLSTLQLKVTDKKLDDLLKLALSIPIPGEEGAVTPAKTTKSIQREVKTEAYVSPLNVVVEEEIQSTTEEDVFQTPPESLMEENNMEIAQAQTLEEEEALKLAKAEQINVALKFEILRINVAVSTQDQFGIETPFLEVDLIKLGTQVSLRQYDLSVMANIGDICVKEMAHGIDGAPLELVCTPADVDMLAVQFVQADKNHPKFKENFSSTEKAIDIQFASLKVVLHQEALLNLMEFADNLLPASEEAIKPQQEEQLEGSSDESEDKTSEERKASKRSKEDEIIEVKVNARLGELTAIVTSMKGDVAQLQMKQLEAGVSMLADRTTVLARMQDFSVLDGIPDALYPKIVSIVNEEVFKVELVIFNGATEGENYGNMEKVDMKFLMNVGKIRVVFLNRFVSNLLAFVNNFQLAQEAIQNAGKTAAQNATQTIQEYNKNSPRVKLDVSIQAPLVLVPVSSRSERALVANLGNLEVHNSFKIVHGGMGQDIAVVDTMKVSFTSLQLSVAVISKYAETIVAQRLILKPISLELSLARSLSSWYHDIPDVDIAGQLGAVTVNIGTDDLKTALAITSENLTEGATIRTDVEDEIASSVSSLAVLGSPDEEVSSISAEEEKNWVTLKFKFGIETIAARIYKNIKELDVNDQSTWEHPPENCLTHFSLDLFNLAGSMLANGGMETSVVLHSISLVDKRPALEKGVTTMIERRTDERKSQADDESSNMLDVHFKQTKELDKMITVLVKGMSIIVNVEFLLVLSNVFTEALPEAPPKESQTNVLGEARVVTTEIASSSTASPTAANQSPVLQVTLTVEEPEIFLLANAKQKNTNALVVKNTLDASLKIRDEQFWFQTLVQNLHVVTAAFEKSRREISQADVLRVKSISLHMASMIGGQPHIDLNTSVAYLNVSPAFAGIASAVATSLAPSKDEDGDGDNKDVPDLFKAVDIADSKKWYLKEVARGQLVAGSRIFARAPDLKSYGPGLITSIDQKITAILDDESSWSCDVNDVRGVVLDETPLAKEIAVGTSVIALVNEGDPMQAGVVTKVIESADADSPNVVVRFSKDKEYVKPFEYIRLLKNVKNGGSHSKPVISSVVYARLPDKEHYALGFIAKKDWRYQVKFANGTHIYHFINDPLALVLDRVPRPEHVTVGCDVVAPIPNKPLMYPGRVKKIVVSGYEIQFDNGAVHEVSIYDLKLTRMPMKEDCRLTVRTLLWIKYSGDKYYRGYIDGIDNKVYVRFYEHEDRVSFGLNDRAGLVPDVTPKEVMVGENVVVLKGTYGVEGVVTKVESRESDPVFLVEGAGSELWVPLKDIRRFEKSSGSKGTPHANEMESLSDHGEEQLILNMDGFVFNVEAEKAGNLISLLNVRGNLHAEVKNWQEKLNGKAELQLEANYFNEELSEWEPLIEKLETQDTFKLWELSVGFKMNQDGSDVMDDSGSQMIVSVESTDVLELTVTKTNLDVFSELGKSFGEAVTESVGGSSIALEKTAPYEIKNELGTNVYIRPGSTFKAPDNIKDDVVLVRSGESLLLHFAKHLSLTSTSSDVESIKIAVQVEGYHEIKDISVKRASSAFFNVVPKKLHKQGFRSIVVQVTSPDGRKLVVLRSPFRMKNHCPVPLEIFVDQNGDLQLLDTLNEEEYLNLPLTMANDDLGYFIKPGGFPYEKSVEEIRLSQVVKNGQKLHACAAPWPDADPFYVQVKCWSERYTSETGSRANQPCYTLHYYPPVVLMNYLPFPIQFSQEGLSTFVTLDGGGKLPIYTVNLDSRPSLNVKCLILGKTYTGQIRLRGDLAQLSVVHLVSGTKKLVVGVYVKKSGSLEITLYSTYWLINHSGLPLEYKASDSDDVIQHPANENDVAIFAFTSKPDMFSKNTLRLRANGSEWSDKFSLDTVGSGGSLKCKKDGHEYGIGSEIRLSYFSLTKIVVFTPLNLLVNHTKHSISLFEAQGVYYTVKPGETIPFWPKATPAKNLKIKTNNSPVESICFDFQSNVNLLLRLDNEVGGVCVTMFSKDAATVMTFTPYFEGSAPLRIDNDSSFEICYRQINSDKVHVLPAKKTTVFTWDNLQGKREVEWFVLGHEKLTAKSKLENNDMGSLGEEQKPLCYWASFLDGLQRVLYFTESYTMAFRAQQDQLEVPSQEVTLSLRGIGLSLVNNKKSVELAYLSITPSNVLWEVQKKKRRWKTMTTKACSALEQEYKILQVELERGEKARTRRKVDNMTVDFELMEILEPDRRPIRRTFHPGVWVQFHQSEHEIQLHSKINDIQIDSQVPGSTFQTLFHSIPPPKTVAESNAPKPVIEASIITRKEENAIVSRIKYFKVLIQELDVKMDKLWLLELVALFGNENQDLDKSNYEEDNKVITTSLQSLNAAVTDVRNFYDYFHLSPIKVHVSFSVQGDTGHSVGGNIVDLLLNSLGVAFSDVQDVVLKLAYFELNHQIYSQSQLTQVAINHYTSQAIKQAYVLVLGLDVLGNPFGLITGLTTGAKDLFYEPYQGLIQGPEEFAEGLALGVKSLVGHTIGGAAGAVSRITGTLGKGVAALTMDDEYQQSRRSAMSRKPTSVKEGLSRGGKSLFEGVYEGVTGVVTKPMEGAKKSGAKGFFKGMGKGLVGVVAKPVSGVVDFASNTFEGIKGTASGDREIKRVRPPRRFYADKIMRPYNRYDAEGVEFLKIYSKGKESLAKDTYLCHYYLANNIAIMITSLHVLLMRKETVIKNEWENVWFCNIKDLQHDPKVNGTKITFSTPEQGKMFKKTGTKVVDMKSAPIAEWIAKNTIEARSLLR